MPVISINIPTKSDIRARTVQCLLFELNRIQGFQFEIKFLIGKSNLDQARSIMLTNWYDTATDDDMFLFIDADQTFKAEDIVALVNLIKNEHADVACGAYARSTGTSTMFLLDDKAFINGTDNRIRFGATGFMMISKPILHTAFEWIKTNDQDVKNNSVEGRLSISEIDKSIIPFFRQRMIPPEFGMPSAWVGEDYSFCWLVRQVGGTIRGIVSRTIGHDVLVTRFLEPPAKEWPSNSIVYFTGASAEQWSPRKTESGIGGSETAVINLAKEWTKLGFSVTVFGNPPQDQEGNHDGVQYLNFRKFNTSDKYNTIIVWRGGNAGVLDIDLNATRVFYDLHDMSSHTLFTPERLSKVHKFFVKSKYHKDYFKPIVPDESKFVIIPNGGTIETENSITLRHPHRLIYTSSYDRGLYYMLQFGWDIIKKAVPDAEFHIYYGWESYDAYPMTDQRRMFKETISTLMQQQGIVHHGRIGQNKLMRARAKSSIHYYVGEFNEIDCISVRESASVGCVPIVSKRAAFDDIERDYIITVDGDPTTKNVQTTTANKIVELLQNQTELEVLSKKVQESKRLQDETWASVAKKWAEHFV